MASRRASAPCRSGIFVRSCPEKRLQNACREFCSTLPKTMSGGRTGTQAVDERLEWQTPRQSVPKCRAPSGVRLSPRTWNPLFGVQVQRSLASSFGLTTTTATLLGVPVSGVRARGVSRCRSAGQTLRRLVAERTRADNADEPIVRRDTGPECRADNPIRVSEEGVERRDRTVRRCTPNNVCAQVVRQPVEQSAERIGCVAGHGPAARDRVAGCVGQD